MTEEGANVGVVPTSHPLYPHPYPGLGGSIWPRLSEVSPPAGRGFAGHSQSWSLRPDEGRRALQFWHRGAAELGYACVLNNACKRLHCWCVHVCPQSACWAVCVGLSGQGLSLWICLCVLVCKDLYLGWGWGRSALSGRSVCLWLRGL